MDLLKTAKPLLQGHGMYAHAFQTEKRILTSYRKWSPQGRLVSVNMGADLQPTVIQPVPITMLFVGRDDFALSPNGINLLLNVSQDQPNYRLADLKRNRVYEYPQYGREDASIMMRFNPLWMADNKRWVQLFAKSDGLYAVVTNIKLPSRQTCVPLGLPEGTVGMLGGGVHSADLLAPLDVNRVLAVGGRTQRGYFERKPARHLELLDFDVHIGRPSLRESFLPLPGDGAVSTIAYTPARQKFAFFLGSHETAKTRGRFPETYSLYTCNRDGSGRLLLGRVVVREPGETPQALRWSPQGKSLSFYFRATLWAIADGNAPVVFW
jgi:hypothetical protein